MCVQLAIITPQINLFGYDTATAQWMPTFRKKGNPAIYDHVDGPRVDHAK